MCSRERYFFQALCVKLSMAIFLFLLSRLAIARLKSAERVFSELCRESHLRIIRSDEAEAQRSDRHFTCQHCDAWPQLIFIVFSIYWVKNKCCTCSTVEINIYAFGFKNSFNLFSVGLFIPKSVIRSELDLKRPCSLFSVVTVWQSESCMFHEWSGACPLDKLRIAVVISRKPSPNSLVLWVRSISCRERCHTSTNANNLS